MSGRRQQNEKLLTTLRGATTRAAELAGGGCALLFSSLPGENLPGSTSQLRAAAGFDSADSARRAAECMRPAAMEILNGGEASTGEGDPSLGALGQAGITIHPVSCDGRINGALLVGYPEVPSHQTQQQISQLANSASIHLDHALISHELIELRKTLCENEAVTEEKSDDLLKLSEALFAQDIELLRNNEKLGKIEKLKNDFIEKMSCELRTPLNSIIESIITVLTGENEAISDGAKDSLRGALNEGTAFQRTLENILDLWRVKQGEMPVESQEVNFSELVAEAIFSVQDTLADKPVEITKDFQVAIPTFRADLAKVNQILFLLLDNSAKFIERGTIHIVARVVDTDLEFEVIDTGIGICADDQEFVFGDFYQVDEGISTKYRGAGLGLTLVRDLLILLEGEVALESEVGKGTHIRVRLPIELIS